jgi:hypothetical protein
MDFILEKPGGDVATPFGGRAQDHAHSIPLLRTVSEIFQIRSELFRNGSEYFQ